MLTLVSLISLILNYRVAACCELTAVCMTYEYSLWTSWLSIMWSIRASKDVGGLKLGR